MARDGLTRRQATVLRALSGGDSMSARDIGVRSDVLWRLEERGMVGRSVHHQWRIRLTGKQALDAYTEHQVERMLPRPRGSPFSYRGK